ncbi:hypothetical protein RBA41_31300 [Massilia sp. CCM 9210]|uniref:hypothetical protein n=1 Tax=Massilia scottii TaxID=3057166 RepID=UPI002796A11C|nr:hypothetical protein [Massilia sp. CCM 9210]MDQ1817797.1 hypothetical protein [Massilia sp. CCM 9210]
MLENIWAFACVIVAILFCLKAAYRSVENPVGKRSDDDIYGVVQDQAIAGSALGMASFFTFSSLWVPLYHWYVSVVPDPSSSLHVFTTLILTFLTWFACMVATLVGLGLAFQFLLSSFLNRHRG